MHTWVRPGPEGAARASVKEKWRDFPGGPEVKILRFQFRVWVPSLVGELGSCMLRGRENKRSSPKYLFERSILRMERNRNLKSKVYN